jgi:hypothetical protein
MKRFIAVVLLISPLILAAQLPLPPNSDIQKSEVSQYMGLVKVTVKYSSPSVRGRKIWDNIVSYGLTNFNAGKSSSQNPSPWRAGANENTTIAFSHDVQVEGQALNAGTYGLHMIPGAGSWVVIFSRNSSSWGSFYYDPEEDALRVTVKPVKSEFTEWLEYHFTERLQNSSTIELRWENVGVPVRLAVPNGDQLYVEELRKQFQGNMGPQGSQFAVWQTWVEAANFCASRKIALDEAQGWLDTYINRGRRYFTLFEAKANLLTAMGKDQEATALMKQAVQLPDATMRQLNTYGNTLLSLRRTNDAIEVFTISNNRYSNDAGSIIGLYRCYTAMGDKEKAAKYGKEAIRVEADPVKKAAIEDEVKKSMK